MVEFNNMKKIIFFYILSMSLLFPNDWMKNSDGFISSTSVVIMFGDEIAPKLGIESPLILSDFRNIENILFRYGIADMKPVFSNYVNFNESHYQFHLHQ